MKVRIQTSDFWEYMKNIRRQLHKIPEQAYKEFATRQLIIDELTNNGADEIYTIAETGIKAVFYGKDTDNAIGFRAELDAVCITEKSDVSYKSQNDGVAHACGHDGHMAMLVALSKVLGQYKHILPVSVVLLFQPGEEGVGGAERMVNEGALVNPSVKEIYGIHVMPHLPKGVFGIKSGELMAQSLEFEVGICGKSAHGATPEKGIDAIVAAAEFIAGIQTIPSRMIPSGSRPVLSIGKINGGTALNIIAEHVTMEGLVRSYSDEISEEVKSLMLKRLGALEETYGVKTTFKELLRYPVVFNDADLAENAGVDNTIEPEPVMMAEDFGYFQKATKGLFMFLGTGDENKPLHCADFNFDENILLCGLKAYLKLILKGNEEFEVL